MEILEYMSQNDFGQLSAYTDNKVGLKAFISIHDTTLGPALGGVRVWPHPTEEAAIEDVLKLGKAMTYNAAAAGLNFGGGMGLIIANPQKDKTEGLMRSFGKFVDSLGGQYLTAEDVGMTSRDLEWIAMETSYVTGLPISSGGSGDTSIMTGFGVYQGMKACSREIWGTDSLSGRTISMQGFGSTAQALANQILSAEENVRLIICDIDKSAIEKARLLGAEIVDKEEIYRVKSDIFSPCALGGILNSETIPQINASIICGSANNQLLDEWSSTEISKRSILYAPDFIVNAGGIINISCEVGRTYNEFDAYKKTEGIYHTIRQIISEAKQNGSTTSVAANRIAKNRVRLAQNKKKDLSK